MVAVTSATSSQGQEHCSMFVLDAGTFKHYIDFFNTMEPENIVNYVSNQQSWAWMAGNIPFFECPTGASSRFTTFDGGRFASI